ncbi:MAG: hypothetical protein RRC07_06175 [Anaerolineae bacterium]|nr:hypothetical protein [Anaerolineae bacterium]
MDAALYLAQETAEATPTIQLAGALAFGMIIGWYVYYINRYREGDVQFSDLITVIGIIGGGAVLSLFEARTDLFGAYGIGLAVGFFGYLVVLALMVRASDYFDVNWFLDGRRLPDERYVIPLEQRKTIAAMGVQPPPAGGTGSGNVQVPD